MTGLQELYRKKGEAQTQIEIWTGILRKVNEQIGKEIGKGGQTIKQNQEIPDSVTPSNNDNG